MGRWSECAKNGHGGNVALRELAIADARHRQQFQFSILRVFSPSAPSTQVDAAEFQAGAPDPAVRHEPELGPPPQPPAMQPPPVDVHRVAQQGYSFYT